LSDALKEIHSKGHTHSNLHPGNIFQVSQDEKLSSNSKSSDGKVIVHPEAIYTSRPLSGIITQGYGLEFTLPQDNSRKSIHSEDSETQDEDKISETQDNDKISETQDKDKIRETISKKRRSDLVLNSVSNNDIPTIK
ncbi:7312_t:CDS:2, partial [Racocetra persica]